MANGPNTIDAEFLLTDRSGLVIGREQTEMEVNGIQCYVRGGTLNVKCFADATLGSVGCSLPSIHQVVRIPVSILGQYLHKGDVVTLTFGNQPAVVLSMVN